MLIATKVAGVTTGSRLACVALLFTVAARANGGGTTEAVCVGLGGVQSLGSSFVYAPAFSADGRYVVFYSQSDNLVPLDVNPGSDCFLRDRWSQTTSLLTLSSTGVQGIGSAGGPVISPSGNTVAFTSRALELVPTNNNNFDDVFVRYLTSGITIRISDGVDGVPGDGHSGGSSISADGSIIAFSSRATNLVPGDTNGRQDIFVHEIPAGVTTRVSVGALGEQADGDCVGASLSADGRFVAFESFATNLGGSTFPAWEPFVHDRTTGETFPIAVHHATGLPVDFGGEWPKVSADGRYVAFESFAPDLVPGDTNGDIDVFVRDLWTATTELVSLTNTGVQANNHCHEPSISADGRYVAFWSSATNLVTGDTNGFRDVFVRDRKLGTTTLVSLTETGQQANGWCFKPAISPDGQYVAFESFATNLVPGFSNTLQDVFLRTCPPPGPETYCPAQPNSLGCQAAIAATGSPSASVGSGFDIDATSVLNGKPGLLIYSKTSGALKLFSGGFLCVQPPLRRTPLQVSGGSRPPAADCTGAFHFDFNAWISTGKDPALVVGQSVWAQYWSRDPLAPATTNLSDALTFVIGN